MTKTILKLSILALTAVFSSASLANNFAGAKPNPEGLIKESVNQLRVEFPEEIKKAGPSPFTVTCVPAVTGFPGWADNNTKWTWDFQDNYPISGSSKLAGGTQCQIKQTTDIVAASGKIWKSGTISYQVSVAGPNVVSAKPAAAFKNSLRDQDPVLLITFDGPVDPNKFFANQGAYLNYLSSNAPSEKMYLSPVPESDAQKIFEIFQNDSDLDSKSRRWILATVKQALIPGAQINLSIEKTPAADTAGVSSEVRFTKEFEVRSNFQAEIQCANPSAISGNCMPNSAITVAMNGAVKWADIKDAYIEYIPFQSTDNKTVRSFAEIDKNRQIGFWDNLINYLSYYFPYLARFSDTVLDSVVFNVNIEPQTQAKVALPAGLQDIEGRKLSNTISEFFIQIGALNEDVRTPFPMSFFEKNIEQLYLPVSVVNMNQTLTIRKSGSKVDEWKPVQDPVQMIQLVRAYAIRGDYRQSPVYTSPLESLSLGHSKTEELLTGTKNRPTVLQFPFASKKTDPSKKPEVGMYAIEVSSPAFEDSRSGDGQFFNPKYVLAQVTDLAIHLKKGKTNTLAWVTSLSTGRPAAGVEVSVYNCLGEQILTKTSDASGLASFSNQVWATDCQVPRETWSSYLQPESYFVLAKTADDQAMIHSSWISSNSSAFSAPGIEWFSSDLREGQAFYHAVIAVNLVKPGQQVPIEILAKIPESQGFSEVPAAQLPTLARIVSQDDNDIFYEFPITFSAGKAQMKWQVPTDSSVKLGAYTLSLKGTDNEWIAVSQGEIEVAEFKIPLMTGLISFPAQELVQPDSIPVSSIVRYANGVGAKKLGAELSYYFTQAQIQNDKLPKFRFGTGPVQIQTKQDSESILPTSYRPATIGGLETAADGSLKNDIALEKISDGRSVSEVLKTLDRPQKLVVRLRYQDQMGEFQTISQAKTIYNASSYLGTALVSGDRAVARLQAASIDVTGKNTTQISDLEFKLIRVESRVIGEELFGGLIKNTLERELKPVRWTPSCNMEKGVASCSVGTLKQGHYAFQVTSKATQQISHSVFKVDGTGRVYGPNDYYDFGDEDEGKQLPLALDKASYKDGESAVVSFAPPFKTCSALVTTERDNVLQAQVIENACEVGNVKLNVNGTQAPNVFVSVYAVTGRATQTQPTLGEKDLGQPTYRLGFANMKVNWGRYSSSVKVTTDKPKYEPGQDVDVTVAVSPDEGSLVDGTVTLVVLEEKILELKANETYKILDALMQMRSHDVDTVTALERIETMSGDQSAPESGRKGGDEGGDGGGASEFKRKLFDALVSYQAGVPVENGVARFKFKTNDSLTKFRVIAIATDSSQKFGMGFGNYLSEKDTQAYSNIPSVAHTGDLFPVKVTVQNNSSNDGTYSVEVTVVMKDKNGQIISEKKLKKSQLIEKSGSSSVDVGNLEISDEAATVEYIVRVYDENGKLVDVLQPEAQVVLASVPLSTQETRILQVENGSLTRTFEKPTAALANKGELRVVASNSLVGSALSQVSLKVDQDRFADLFVESRFNKALLTSTEAKPDELKSVLQTLVSQLDNEGFVKYYPEASKGNLYLTANIINSLQLRPWTLKLMPTALQQKLKSAVSKVLTKSVNPTYVGTTAMDWLRAQSVMARAAFAFQDQQLVDAALAFNESSNKQLAANPNAFGQPVEKWTTNTLLDRWLVEVYAAPKAATQTSVYKQLVGPARLNFAGNQAVLNGAPEMSWTYSDETAETAKLLLGLAKVQGDANLARALAVGLVNASTDKWYNLVTLSRVSEGLRQFASSYEPETVKGSALIAIPEEQQSATVDFNQKSTGGLVSEWKSSQATVNVTYAGTGQPWVSLQALSAVPLTQARGQGLSVEKVMKNITRDGDPQTGDIIEVTLTLHSSTPVQHVAVHDPIPAGSNILAAAYGDASSGQKSYSGYKLYFSTLESGSSTVKYQYQLNNPGTFKLPPTHAEALFMPSIYADTPNAEMKVK